MDYYSTKFTVDAAMATMAMADPRAGSFLKPVVVGMAYVTTSIDNLTVVIPWMLLRNENCVYCYVVLSGPKHPKSVANARTFR